MFQQISNNDQGFPCIYNNLMQFSWNNIFHNRKEKIIIHCIVFIEYSLNSGIQYIFLRLPLAVTVLMEKSWEFDLWLWFDIRLMTSRHTDFQHLLSFRLFKNFLGKMMLKDVVIGVHVVSSGCPKNLTKWKWTLSLCRTVCKS